MVTVNSLQNRPPAGRSWKTLLPLPAVATKLLALLEDEKASLGEISRVIQLDAAFTAEVLRLANSAVVASRFEVLNPLHAASVLGLSRIRSLVLTVALRDCLTSMRTSDLVRRCWRHNLATALACERLAELSWEDRPVAYMTGLLHDLGRLALVATDPQAHSALVDRAAASDRPIASLERETFGADSHAVTLELAHQWKLPQRLVSSACRQSHAEERGVVDPVSLGCLIASRLGFSIAAQGSTESDDELEAVAAQWAAAGHSRVAEQFPELVETVMLRLNLFECEFMPS